MAYVPNPQDPTQPTIGQLAGNMAYELQALKGYIASLVASGTNFAYIGGFRNRLKNGSFSTAQRGILVSPAIGTPTYTLDQWQVTPSGNSAVVSRLTVSPPPGGNFSLLMTGSVPGTTNVDLLQKIESFDSQDMLTGISVTVSGLFFVSDVLVGLPTISLLAPTVLDNWGASVVVGAAVPMSLNSGPQIVNTWQSFSNTFILTGDCTKGMGLKFTVANLGIKTASFASLQLEKGSQHTQFEWRPIQIELALCQRYYQQLTSLSASVATGAGQACQYVISFPVAMRVAPTVTRSGTSVINATIPTPPSTNTLDLADSYTSVAAGVYSLNYLAVLSAEL
jgi:hypothetical protein